MPLSVEAKVAHKLRGDVVCPNCETVKPPWFYVTKSGDIICCCNCERAFYKSA